MKLFILAIAIIFMVGIGALWLDATQPPRQAVIPVMPSLIATTTGAGIATTTSAVLPAIRPPVAAMLATHTVGTATATPPMITVGTSTQVTVTIQITDPALIANSVNLLRLGAPGTQPAVLGVMQSAGNGIYTLDPTFNEQSTGQVQLQVSAAFKGALQRVLSNVVIVSVWGVIADPTSGFKTLYPPVLYDLSSTTTAFNGFLLQSSPEGVDIGGEGPEDGSNATTTGFSIVIHPIQYGTSFDINAWLSTEYPYSEIDTLTSTTVGGVLGYAVTFKNEVGAGQPTIVVYNQGYIYKLSYASTFPLGSIADQNGLNAFNAVLQHFIFSR
jgi:hypothetical protein